MKKAYKHKIYPTKAQQAVLEQQLAEACRLYNAAIQERTEAWQRCKLSISWYDQKKSLTAIRQAGDTTLINCGTGQQILKRVDLAFKAFFDRVKKGKTPGYPRYKSSRYFDSLPYQMYGNGCRIEGRRLYLQGIGNIKVRWHRELPEGAIKTVTVKREGRAWYAVFVVEYEPTQAPSTGQSVGIDVGLNAFVALSTGETVDNPRWFREAEHRLRIAQRKMSRRKKFSGGWHKAKAEVRAIHQQIVNRRNLFHHELSRVIVDDNDLIAVEDLNIKGMTQGNLAKSIHDAGWANFTHCLKYKAAELGKQFVAVKPHGTSQTCVCGAAVPKTLAVRTHLCPDCGAKEDRDVMSAKVILQRALNAL